MYASPASSSPRFVTPWFLGLHTMNMLANALDLVYTELVVTRALRAHRVIFMIYLLHISNALRPVTTRCGNSDLSPPFGYQDRQSIIPRRGFALDQ
eukprot:COSAG02_NODE_2182_length_9582_cov_4.266582_2_plen_96_part_00